MSAAADPHQQRVAERALELEEAAARLGIAVSGDGRCGERGAASLLGVHVSTLRRWRLAGEGPPFSRMGSRFTYWLCDLAATIEASRCTPAEFALERERASVRERQQSSPSAPSATAGSGAGSALTDQLPEHHQ